jgi:serine protease Do
VVNISSTSRPKTSGRESRRDDLWERSPFRDFFGDDFFRYFFEEPRERTRVSLGSGVIVSKEGHILTNSHVVAGADIIKVTLNDKQEFDAKVVGTDKATDVAVIKIDAKDLPAARLGNSDELQVGEWVLAIGNPFRLSHTVTAGIISATGRSDVRIAEYEDFIQTDAAINPGNSGGPLVNIDGEVIGINTAIATSTGVPGNVGVGFAIPINMALNVMEQLIDKGQVVRGWLGVSLQDVTTDIAEKYGLDEPGGALIVSTSGPARKAGLEPGDLIIEFDGKTVRDVVHLKTIVAAIKPGDTIKVKVIRDNKEKSFSVKLAERTEKAIAELTGEEITPSEKEEEEWLGMTVQELADELAQQLGYEGQQGVLVSEVDPDGPAAKVNDPPKRGDLIQEIERQEIKNMEDYREAIGKVKDQKSVLVRLRRAGGRTWYVVIKKEE